MKPQGKPAGMTAFIIVWIGQIVSQLGSAMTGFGMSIWLFGQTGEAATLTWAVAAFMAPLIFLSPIAGTIVDRSNRKWIMIITDGIAGLTTIILLLLLATGNLVIWHIYVLNFINGAFNSLQWPAFSASVTMLIKKEHYARASGLMSSGEAGSAILAPSIAAALLAFSGLEIILIIDIVSFLFAIGALLLINIPQPPQTAGGRTGQGSFWQETAYGFTYIFARRSLLGLQLVFLGINFVAMFGIGLMVPMILAETGNSEVALGSVQSLGALGGVAGGLLLAAWGGPRKKVHGVLGGMLLASLCGHFVMGLGNTLVVWAAGLFMAQLIMPIINGSNQAIWQAKVAPDVQGRVFSVRRLIAQLTAPVAVAIAGPLADRVFEPAMLPGGALVDLAAPLVGSGPGAGMSLMLVLSGLLGAGVALTGYLSPAVRNAETLLPDHVAVKTDADGTPAGEAVAALPVAVE